MHSHAAKIIISEKIPKPITFDYNIGNNPLHFNTEIGNVDIDLHSIKDSLAHKFSQAKLDAITSLKDGFPNSVYLGTLKDSERKNKGKDVQNHYFAYPINYNNERYYVFCRAIEDNNLNRIHVHEVFIADNIKTEGHVLQTVARQPRGNMTSYKAILANVLDAANVANNSETRQESAGENETKASLRNRNAAHTRVDGLAQAIYDKAVKGSDNRFPNRFEWDEAWHDSLKAVDELQKALVQERGKDISDIENVYLHAIHLSKTKAQPSYESCACLFCWSTDVESQI